MDNQTVTLLMPVYNRQDLVISSIKSVIKQTHKSIQLVIYNDGSTDKTLDIISTIANKDKRIKIINCTENNGIVYARNKLLEAIETKYAAWIDSDDICSTHRIHTQLNIALQGYDIVFGNWKPFSGTELPKYGDPLKKSTEDRKHYPTILFNAEKAPKFEEKLRNDSRGRPTTILGEDIDWYQRYAGQGVKVHTSLREVVYFYRRHNNRVTMWGNNPKLNKKWYDRMSDRVKPNL